MEFFILVLQLAEQTAVFRRLITYIAGPAVKPVSRLLSDNIVVHTKQSDAES